LTNLETDAGNSAHAPFALDPLTQVSPEQLVHRRSKPRLDGCAARRLAPRELIARPAARRRMQMGEDTQGRENVSVILVRAVRGRPAAPAAMAEIFGWLT